MTTLERMSDPIIKAMLEAAAEEGAKRALASIGLHDESAAKDVRELRGLLEGWRDAKKAVIQTVVRSVTMGILALIAAGVAVKLFIRSQ